MGRNIKKGLQYFNIDCVMDDKVNYIQAKFGLTGFAVLVKIWAKIYMHEGFYCDWDQKNIFLFSKETGIEIDLINEIIEDCFIMNLFHREIFMKKSILTSAAIQKRWRNISISCRRKDFEIPPEFDVMDHKNDITDCKNAFPHEEIMKNTPQITHKSKVKESKVKENINTGATKLPHEPMVNEPIKNTKKFIPPTFQELFDYFTLTAGNPKNPGYWPSDRCSNEAAKMIDHYKSNGWVQGRGKPIKDWKASCRNWIRNAKSGIFEKPSYSQNTQQAPVISMPIKKTEVLDKYAIEVNYFYGLFLEGKTTVISINEQHYNIIKKSGFINFSETEIEDIKKKAIDYIQNTLKSELTDDGLLKVMKRFGVIEFFEQYKMQGKETVFYVDAKASSTAVN